MLRKSAEACGRHRREGRRVIDTLGLMNSLVSLLREYGSSLDDVVRDPAHIRSDMGRLELARIGERVRKGFPDFGGDLSLRSAVLTGTSMDLNAVNMKTVRRVLAHELRALGASAFA